MAYTAGPVFSLGKHPHKMTRGRFRHPAGGQNAASPAQHSYRIAALLDDGRVVNYEHSAPTSLCLEDICAGFARGTLIATSTGQVAVEDLHPGDSIKTRDNDTQILRWLGSCSFPVNRGKQAAARAIRIKSDALGEMRPIQDLVVSSRFRLLTNHPGCAALFGSAETLAPVIDLLDGDTILAVRPSPDLEFFNLMFDHHQIITANGLETESYHPGDFGTMAMSLEMQSHLRRIFPQLNDNLTGFGQTARPLLKGVTSEVLRAG